MISWKNIRIAPLPDRQAGGLLERYVGLYRSGAKKYQVAVTVTVSV